MARAFADLSRSVILVVDVQENFLKAVWEAERVRERSEFLIRSARILGGTVIATEQNPARLGATHPSLVQYLSEAPDSKMTFSCSGCELFQRHLGTAPPTQVVLVGVETHVCVSQTAHELLDYGHEVIVCGDAVSSRTPDRHEMGLRRLESAGAVVAHTESVVYEWMRTADNEKFRDVLEVVKSFG